LTDLMKNTKSVWVVFCWRAHKPHTLDVEVFTSKELAEAFPDKDRDRQEPLLTLKEHKKRWEKLGGENSPWSFEEYLERCVKARLELSYSVKERIINESL